MRSHRPSEPSPIHSVGGYQAWRCPRGRPYDLLWTSRAGDAPIAHRILPAGEPSIAIRRRRDGAGRIDAVELVICAVYDTPFHYQPPPGEELIALRLKPENSAALLGVDPREFRNTVPAAAPRRLQDRLGASRRIAETGSHKEIAAALMADIDAVADDDAEYSPLVARAAALIRGVQGGVGARETARKLAVSDRHLRRAFKDVIGCSPKTFARRVRLTAAAIAADAADRPDWAQIALTTGYHDQSHLIAEYRALVGQTPAQNHRERRTGSAFSNTPGAP